MKKSEVKDAVSVLNKLPLKECQDRDMKIALIQDRVYLKRLASEIDADIDSLRKEIIGDKQSDVNEYFKAVQMKDGDKMKKMIPEVREAILDFDMASNQLLSQDVVVQIPCTISEKALIGFVVDSAPEMIDDIDILVLNLT